MLATPNSLKAELQHPCAANQKPLGYSGRCVMGVTNRIPDWDFSEPSVSKRDNVKLASTSDVAMGAIALQNPSVSHSITTAGTGLLGTHHA
jgi:hypothetical protein